MDRKTRSAAQLVRLTDVALTAAQTRLATLQRTEAELRTKLAALNASRRAAGAGDMDDPATRAGADILWQRWADTRRVSLNAELARTLVAKGQAQAALARHFGRHEAIKGIAETLRSDAMAARARRAPE